MCGGAASLPMRRCGELDCGDCMEGVVRVPLAVGTPPQRRRRMTMDKVKMMVLQ